MILTPMRTFKGVSARKGVGRVCLTPSTYVAATKGRPTSRQMMIVRHQKKRPVSKFVVQAVDVSTTMHQQPKGSNEPAIKGYRRYRVPFIQKKVPMEVPADASNFNGWAKQSPCIPRVQVGDQLCGSRRMS